MPQVLRIGASIVMKLIALYSSIFHNGCKASE